MTSVYLATSGSYSDYRVVCGFTTKEAASAYCAEYNARKSEFADPLDVEEFPLFDSAPGPDQLVWVVRVAVRDKAVSHKQTWSYKVHPWEEHPVNEWDVADDMHGLTHTISSIYKEEAEKYSAEWVAEQIKT
jgi:hypothetical protein